MLPEPLHHFFLDLCLQLHQPFSCLLSNLRVAIGLCLALFRLIFRLGLLAFRNGNLLALCLRLLLLSIDLLIDALTTTLTEMDISGGRVRTKAVAASEEEIVRASTR